METIEEDKVATQSLRKNFNWITILSIPG